MPAGASAAASTAAVASTGLSAVAEYGSDSDEQPPPVLAEGQTAVAANQVLRAQGPAGRGERGRGRARGERGRGRQGRSVGGFEADVKRCSPPLLHTM